MPATAPSPSYACELVQAELQLCGVDAASVRSTIFATCAAAAIGVGNINDSPVVPRSIVNVNGVSCNATDAPECCCDMATMVQFDVVAADTTLAQAYSAAVSQNLPGQAMLACLKVGTPLSVVPQVLAFAIFELTADCLYCAHGCDDTSSKWPSS